MSNKTDPKDIYIDWLENSIADVHFRYYEYSDFKNVKKIGTGASGNVVRVNWKDTDLLFALKSLKNDSVSLKEVVNEVQSLHFNGLLRKLKLMNIKCFIDKTSSKC